ncbi:MAG: hypothetical protein KDK36_12835 [Leptospiraceae bacterium]|nr:hypothetical protein [Leptospiraceae bacterium]
MSQDRMLKAQRILKQIDEMKIKFNKLEKDVKNYMTEEQFFKDEGYQKMIEKSSEILIESIKEIA